MSLRPETPGFRRGDETDGNGVSWCVPAGFITDKALKELDKIPFLRFSPHLPLTG